jgi:hypothetical protein
MEVAQGGRTIGDRVHDVTVLTEAALEYRTKSGIILSDEDSHEGAEPRWDTALRL